jgi:hypothetical protein
MRNHPIAPQRWYLKVLSGVNESTKVAVRAGLTSSHLAGDVTGEGVKGWTLKV